MSCNQQRAEQDVSKGLYQRGRGEDSLEEPFWVRDKEAAFLDFIETAFQHAVEVLQVEIRGLSLATGYTDGVQLGSEDAGCLHEVEDERKEVVYG